MRPETKRAYHIHVADFLPFMVGGISYAYRTAKARFREITERGYNPREHDSEVLKHGALLATYQVASSLFILNQVAEILR
ncbi:MAG: hypothetical protein ABIH92_03200 [Nanoarchaeota archaeon]